MPAAPKFFSAPEDFRRWLRENAATTTELVVGFYKVDSGRPSITWPESVDEALCVGWIDGIRKRIDDHSYQIRFTPRRTGSIWSSINIARVKALTSEGRMTETGHAAFQRRTERKSSVYSYEQKNLLQFTPEELRNFKKSKAAWKYSEKLPPGYKRTMTFWVVSAKRAETRAERLRKFIQSCKEGKRLLP